MNKQSESKILEVSCPNCNHLFHPAFEGDKYIITDFDKNTELSSLPKYTRALCPFCGVKLFVTDKSKNGIIVDSIPDEDVLPI